MTCQSSLLIGVLNELCLPVCTLESDFQLPRQLQFIWQYAGETALPYFSDSSAVLNVKDTLRLKGSIIFYFILFCSICLWPSLIIFSMLNQSLKKMDFFSKWSLSSRKETPKISAFVSLQTVLWVCASTPRSIKMPHSKIKELICREENSAEAQWARRLSRGWCRKTRGVKQSLFNHKRFMYCLCPSGCGLFQYVFLNTFFQSLPIVRLCVVHLSAVGPHDAWEINDAVQNLSEFISGPWSILVTLLPLHLYCNDLSFLETAAICKSYARLINVVYKFSR